jgi:putative membrane protein
MLSFLLGVLTGALTGVLPSLHINTVAFLLAAANPQMSYLSFASFIVGLSVAHNFFDFIPAIVFGSGEEGASLSTFAGNKMFMQGRGLHALKLASTGALMGSLFFLALLPFLGAFLPTTFEILSRTAWAGLLGITLHLILKDKSIKHAAIIFITSGALGFLVLETGALQFPLLSLFSGMFGLGLLWNNLKIKQAPEQIKTYGIAITKKDLARTGMTGLLSSIILGLVPAIGPTQASVLTYSEDEESFLVKIGVVNVADVFISLLTLFLIGKARSGALVELQNFGNLAFSDLTLLFLIGFVSAVISFALVNYLGGKIIRLVTRINYQRLALACAAFILIVNFAFNGYYGLVVCVAGAIISRKAVQTGVMKSHCMGVLILPTLVNYLVY